MNGQTQVFTRYTSAPWKSVKAPAGRGIPGAFNIPVGELKRRLAELPKKREIVAYCRGPYCVMAFEAVAALRENGFKTRRLEDGMPEWRAAGLPVNVGAEA